MNSRYPDPDIFRRRRESDSTLKWTLITGFVPFGLFYHAFTRRTATPLICQLIGVSFVNFLVSASVAGAGQPGSPAAATEYWDTWYLTSFLTGWIWSWMGIELDKGRESQVGRPPRAENTAKRQLEEFKEAERLRKSLPHEMRSQGKTPPSLLPGKNANEQIAEYQARQGVSNDPPYRKDIGATSPSPFSTEYYDELAAAERVEPIKRVKNEAPTNPRKSLSESTDWAALSECIADRTQAASEKLNNRNEDSVHRSRQLPKSDLQDLKNAFDDGLIDQEEYSALSLKKKTTGSIIEVV